MHNLSPGVERALETVRAIAPQTASVSDWLNVLLADDEARPAMLLARLGIDRNAILDSLRAVTSTPAPHWDDLARLTRNLSVALRGDPDFTTDHVFIAILKAAPATAAMLNVNVAALEAALRSPLIETGEPVPVNEPAFILPDVTDRHDATRIVDVNLNRARESLRILDDYARFIRNDATLTALVKSLRHRLAELNSTLPLPSVLAARDTGGDVGTGISTSGEFERGSPSHVATVNCKRLQESLRSAEEFGKLLGPHVARELEATRYESYTLEKALLGGSPLKTHLHQCRLYFLVSAAHCTASLEWTVQEALAGGVHIVQLREKTLPDRELLATAMQMREWTRKANALFIVNDRPDIARLAGADGVHLGQEDLKVSDARRILGPDALIGVSTHNLEQIRFAIRDGADHLGVGPAFPSTTKAFESLAGVAFIREAAAATSLPQFVLGGINLTTIDDAVAAGATRVAVSAVLAQADDPRLVAKRLRQTLE